MATTTRILDANVNGTVYTANANDALEALDTCHSGATAPTDEVANGKLWLDTSTTPGILKIYNNATWEVVHSGTVDINGGTIDGATINGTIIGGTTPAAITGTTLTATGAFTSLGIDDNAAATAMTLDASGNVGIGTATPNAVGSRATVNVSGSAGAAIRLSDDTANMSIDYTDAIGGRISVNAAEPLVLSTNSSERMRIDSNGSILFNTTTVSNGSNNSMSYDNTGDQTLILSSAGVVGSYMIRFMNGNGTVGQIISDGSSTTYNTTSDYRLKENITPVQGAGDIVKAMRPVTYNFKADSTDWHDGFLAHELQELHPRAVFGDKDAMKYEAYEVTPAVLDGDGNVVTEAVMGTRSVPDYQSVDYSKLTPILTAALQEALNKIDALEARVAALEP